MHACHWRLREDTFSIMAAGDWLTPTNTLKSDQAKVL